MANPYAPPTSKATSSEALSLRFTVARAIAFGMGVSGMILCCLYFFMPLALGVSAYCKIIGGVLLVVASSVLALGISSNRTKLTNGSIVITMATAILFFIFGGGWMAAGFVTVSDQRESLNDVRRNLESMADAIDAYEQRQNSSAGNSD